MRFLKKIMSCFLAGVLAFTMMCAFTVSAGAQDESQASKYAVTGKYDGDVFVIGGESIYRAMLPYCDTALVTRIDYAYEADTWFPNLDEDEEWELTDEGEEQTCFDLEYAFTRYERK